MKKLLIMLTLSTCLFPALAFQYPFNNMKLVEDYDGKYLINNTKSDKNYSVLDCQSFIHKIDIYDKEKNIIHENFIDVQECEELYFKIMGCIKDEGSVCIDGQNIFQADCACD